MTEQEIIGLKELGARYATGNLKAFLKGKKNDKWIIGTLRTAVHGHKLPIQELENIFNQHKGFGDV